MDDAERLDVIRQAFAQQLLFLTRLDDARLQAAFAAVRREAFLGPPPWLMAWGGEYVPTPSGDPVYLYTDAVFAILPERHLNNGQPSFHARLLASAAISEGDHVVHVGTGTGYYTAIMAQLTGPSGRVTAIEVDPELARRAKQNLADLPHVRVLEGDAGTVPFDPADAIYVNAGTTHPAPAWLDGLKPGGRLIIPLTIDRPPRPAAPPVPFQRQGAVFRIERRHDGYGARWVSGVGIIPCEGQREPASEAALAAALASGGWERVTRLYRGEDIAEERCWLRAPGWCLAYG